MFLRRVTELSRTLLEKYDSLAVEGPMYFSGKEGAIELREIFEELRVLATRVVQRRSATEWLLLVRRAFIAPFDGVSLAPDWFIESFLRRSTKANQDDRFYRRRLRVNPTDLEDLHDLIMVTSAMWQVGRAFRTVVKGLVVTIARGPLFVGISAPTDSEIVEGISLFEGRRSQSFRDSELTPSPNAGTVRRRFAPEPEQSPYEGANAGFFETGSSDDRHRYPLRWRTHYRPMFLDPAELLDRPTTQPPSIKSLAASVILNACWQDIGLNRRFRFRSPRGAWGLWGVHAMPLSELTERLHKFTPIAVSLLPEWTAEAALAALRTSSQELEWVDSDLAILLELDNEVVLVDLIAGTSAVECPYRRPPNGSVSVEWTSHFEDQVQGIIDASKWKPSATVRSLRNKTLRRTDGTDITETDAIGMFGDVLLLVSVKAWTQPEMLEFGEYGSVNNRANEVEKAVSEWNSKALELAVHPEVRKVAGGASVLGFVISPEVQYVLEGVSTVDVLPGLRAASSYLEFEQFLSQ